MQTPSVKDAIAKFQNFTESYNEWKTKLDPAQAKLFAKVSARAFIEALGNEEKIQELIHFLVDPCKVLPPTQEAKQSAKALLQSDIPAWARRNESGATFSKFPH